MTGGVQFVGGGAGEGQVPQTQVQSAARLPSLEVWRHVRHQEPEKHLRRRENLSQTNNW